MVGDEATVTKELGRLADAGVTEYMAAIFGVAPNRRTRGAEVDALSDGSNRTRWLTTPIAARLLRRSPCRR